jgi:hypothetical protein
MIIRLCLSVLILFPLVVNAASMQAEARAATREQAERQALSDLANSIFVNVQSESSSYVEGSGKRRDEVWMKSSSDVPLIGAEINCESLGLEVVCKVRLDSGKSLALYAGKLLEISKDIAMLEPRIAKAKEVNLYALLTQALTLVEQYEKYRAVALQLGGSQYPMLSRTRADTETQIRSIEKSAPSIEIAAQVLAKGLKGKSIYVYPAMPLGSHEVTPFGRVMRDRLSQNIVSVTSPDKAELLFKGNYEILDNNLHLNYRLLDRSGNTLETKVVMLAEAAYKNLQVKPVTMDFDRLLHQGVAESNDFRVQVNTNRGGEDLLFDENEEIELVVKVNRPAYFYVVGHVLKEDESYSYLLELQQGKTDRRFVRYVNADDANKWMSIGKFEAAAPFGVESIQLVASSDDPINRLPRHSFDQNNDQFVTSGDVMQGVIMTRSLKQKRTKSDRQYQSETALMFTTMPKRER